MPGRLFTMLGAALLLLAACSSISGSESSAVPAETPAVETMGDNSGDEAQPLEAQPDPEQLTFAVENPDDVFDPASVPEVSVPDLATPEELPELDSQVIEAIAEAVDSPDVAILDVAGVVDDGPTAAEIASFRDGNTRSATGELIVLDQKASLACANVEIALSNLDNGDGAAAVGQVETAAARSRLSKLSEIRAWSSALSAGVDDRDGVTTVDPTVLVGFLAVCVGGGHAL